MKHTPTPIDKIDWPLLRTQKRALIELLDGFGVGHYPHDDLAGLIALIDGLQDYAVDELGIPEHDVFMFGEGKL